MRVALSLGPIEFDAELLKRQLRRDLIDDWFPDPLRFSDMLESDHIETILLRNFQQNDGAFVPAPRTLLNIPKANFTLRYGLETSLAERALYHALVSKLVPYYDRLIPWNVLNHRAAPDGDTRYLFRRAIPAWQDFTGVVRNSLADTEYLLSTDLTNYFENIDLGKLRTTLGSLLPEVEADANGKAAIRANLDVLFECLKSWCFSDKAGLPQNRDASSFLANVYMLPVDRAMLGKGYRYFRYMDDIKIACSSEHAARQALKTLSLALRDRGLAVNSGKTSIVAASSIADVDKCLDAGDPEIQKIDSIWHTRSLRPISRSFPLLQQLTLRKLRAGDVASRAFRYCIRRLEALATCPEFEVPDEYFAAITPLVLSALSHHPASTDELTKYLRAVPTSRDDLSRVAGFLMDENLNFYTWQCYRLWALLVEKKYLDAQLLAFAMDVVRSGRDDAARCGATLYAGALGEKDVRIEIASRFADLHSFIGQRAALLAVQELHFRPHIENYIVRCLRPDLQNVYKQLSRRGVYVESPEPMSITRVLDVERDYD